MNLQRTIAWLRTLAALTVALSVVYARWTSTQPPEWVILLGSVVLASWLRAAWYRRVRRSR